LATLRNPVKSFKLIRRLRQTYGVADLVVGHMGNGARIGAPLADYMNVPILGIFGGSDINVEFDKPIYRDAYRGLMRTPCARFLTVAGYLRQKLIDKGVARERLFTWHRGTDLSMSEPAAHASRRGGRSLQVAIVGRFLEVKGHEDMIRALALLRAAGVDVVLNLFGDGPLLAHLEGLSNKLGVRDVVCFHGHVKHSEIIRQMARQDVYVHPSVTCSEGRTEGIPNAIMEAHAAGLPVVATKSGGIPEVVVDGETGFLVDEHDPAALAAKVEVLARDHGLRVEMGARGRAHVEAEFSRAKQSHRLAAHATHLIRQGKLFGMTPDWERSADASAMDAHRSLDLRAKSIAAAGRPRFSRYIPVFGRAIDRAQKFIYTMMVKRYLRAFGGELEASRSRMLRQCVDVQQVQRGGKLSLAAESQQEVSLQAYLCEIDDLGHLMSELARVLQAGGEAKIDISWPAEATRGAERSPRERAAEGAGSRLPAEMFGIAAHANTAAILEAAALAGLHLPRATAVADEQQSGMVDSHGSTPEAVPPYGGSLNHAVEAACCVLVKAEAGVV